MSEEAICKIPNCKCGGRKGRAELEEENAALLDRVAELEAALSSKFSVCPGPDALIVCEDSRAMEGFINARGIKACHPHHIVLRAKFEENK